MNVRLISHLAVGLLLVLTVSACATPRARHSGRRGFISRLSEMDRRNRSKASYSTRTQAPRGSSSSTVAKSGASQVQKSSASQKRLRQVTSKWTWPLESVRVTSDFGPRSGEHHEGIDLKATSGTPVYSVGSGVVLYAGNRISGYGNMVIVGHEGDLSTIYAHNSRLYVKKGQTVKSGQRIALSGNTGKSSGPHLHFEVRSGLVALDPLKVMPSQRGLASSSKRTRGLASADITSRK
jgi:murein DD-endopeptidase MepM/ murein hydrolase activator NlpD